MKLTYIINVVLAVLLSLQTSFAAVNESEAEFKKLKESWVLLPDGSQEYHFRKELTLFTHTAMNDTYGETFIQYNPEFQELRINESYTVQKDGAKVKTPANAFVEVLPSSAAGMPAFNRLIEMVVVHTGLELGATIVLDYTLVSKPGYLPEIDVCQKLQQSSPVKDYQLSFTYPKSKKPHYTTLAVKPEVKKTSSKDSETVTFRFSELPAQSRAPKISLQNGDVPGLLFTTYSSNAAALKTVYDQFDDPAVLTDLFKEITKNVKGRYAVMNAVYDYVLYDIDACYLPLSATGYRIRPAAEVIRSAYATEVEKVNILNALMNIAGFKAAPAVAYDLDVEPEYCGLAAVGKWMVISRDRKHAFQLDALSTDPAGYSSSFLVNLEDGAVKKVQDYIRTIKYTAEISWEENRPVATVRADFANELLPNYLIRASDFMQMNKGSKRSHYCNTTIFTGNANVTLTPIADHAFLKLPETYVGADSFRYAGYNTKREVNLLLPAKFQEVYDYTVHLPENYTFNGSAVNKVISNSVGSLTVSIRQQDGKLTVHRELSVKKRLITPQEFPAFRNLMVEWNEPNLKQLVLKRK